MGWSVLEAESISGQEAFSYQLSAFSQTRAAVGYHGGRSAMQDFRQLKVWQKAHALTLAVYPITAALPREEMYGLTSQLRRASASIAANLAEGCGRNGDAELARFCSIALGSASELEYHLLLAKDLKLIKPKDYELLAGQATEVKRRLTAFRRKLITES
jgi:four helix bundle protein